MKKTIIIYGPPGSGKGTQAELLARKFPLIHFDTGRYIESVIRAPGAINDPVIKREKKNFDTGILCTPSWVLKIIRDAVKRIGGAGYGIVFSGSPRTLFEAFGDTKNQGEIELFKKIFGKKHIHVIRLNVRESSSLKRNSARLVCSVCGLPILATSKNKTCSLCGGAFRKRSLDTPDVIKVRFREYRNRTYPILDKMKKIGFKITEIDGEKPPYKVHEEILKKLHL